MSNNPNNLNNINTSNNINDLNNINKLPPKTHGKKLLMTLKNAENIYNNYSNPSIEDYYNFMEQNDAFINEYKEIIQNEEEEINMNKNKEKKDDEISQEMLSDINIMLKEIQELKSNINEFKLKNKIKTKRDYLKYMNLIDNENNINENNNNINEKKGMFKSQNIFYNNKLEKSFKKYLEEDKYSEYKKYLIPKESQKEKDFLDIKEKLQKQQELIKQFEQMEINKNINKENNNNEKINLNEAETEADINENNNNDINDNNNNDNKFTGDEDVDKLLNEIKLADEKMDNYLKDIDACLEMNENIEKQLNNNEEVHKQINEEN